MKNLGKSLGVLKKKRVEVRMISDIWRVSETAIFFSIFLCFKIVNLIFSHDLN